MQKYSEVRQLYQMIQSEVRNSSPRLSRFLNWEHLRLDLLEILDTPVHVCQSSSYRAEIVQRIMSLLASYKKERGKLCFENLQLIFLFLPAAVII